MACSNTKDCYSTADPSGVSIVDGVIDNLKKKGYETREIDDILLDRPRRIYEVKKEASKLVEYVYIIWGNGTGTRILTLRERVDNWDRLVTLAKL